MISREDCITQSVTDYVRDALVSRGYPADQWELVESFDYEQLRSGLTRNVVALGFNFDEPPEQAELGSDLVRRTYTIEFFVVGMTHTYARNLANVVKFALEHDGRIPLKDVEDPARPVIDQLTAIGAHAARQPIADPEPWQQNVWTTVLRLEDEYHASLV